MNTSPTLLLRSLVVWKTNRGLAVGDCCPTSLKGMEVEVNLSLVEAFSSTIAQMC